MLHRPNHLIVPNVTECELQEIIAWAFEVWLGGRFPKLDHQGLPWPAGCYRVTTAESGIPWVGGHVAVYCGMITDSKWMYEHFRYRWNLATNEICHECGAMDVAGPGSFLSCGPFAPRSHSAYMASTAARTSPLTRIPGFHCSTTRAEAMHAGPLGALQDAVGTSIIELADEGAWGCVGMSPWKFRLGSQLQYAFAEFSQWSNTAFQRHTIKRFTCAQMSMKTLDGSCL